MTASYTVQQLASIVGGVLRGDGAAKVDGVAEVGVAGPHQVSFVSNPKYAKALAESSTGAVLVPAGFGDTPMPAILCDHIDRSVAKLLGAFAGPVSQPAEGVDRTSVVHESAELGAGVSIGAHVVIDAGVRIGAGCILHAGVFVGRDTTVGEHCEFWPNVVIRDGCVIGSRVIVHANAVIGSDGLGFYFDAGRHHKIPHTGGVVLEDDVEVGSCSCVDRAKFGMTVVGAGTKIDNLVQVAHNVQIGRHCVLAAASGIAGSTRVGDYCLFGGRVGVVDNLTIGARARMAAGSLVLGDVAEGEVVAGSPAQEHRKVWREHVWVSRLPQLAQQVKDLTARLERLEASDDHQS